MGGTGIAFRHRHLGFQAALLAALLVLAAGIPALSQTRPSYMLGSGDVLEVSVWGHDDLMRQVTVRPDGKIALPLVGTVTAAGISIEQLTRNLTRAYAVYLVNPKVSVIVRQFRTIRVAVVGQVTRPGSYQLEPGSRLLDLLSAAGGVTDAAALTQAQLLRPGEPPVAIDLERLLAGDPVVNILLLGDEVLVVPEDLVNFINVQGEVVHPGRFRLRGQMRVLDVLLQAGGLTERASLTKARLVRASGETQSLSLDALLLRQEMSHNLVLKPGDTLFIPEETDNLFYVLGDVRQPGAFTIRRDQPVTLLQAIAMAGGPAQGPGAARTAHIVRRAGPLPRDVPGIVKSESLQSGGVLITVNIANLMQSANLMRDLTIQRGDLVVVPQSGLAGLQVVLNILSGLLGIFWR